MVELVDINSNVSDSIKYSIKFLIGNTIIVTKDFLKVIYKKLKISQKKKCRALCFQKCYHIYNRNSNPGMTSYLIYIPNPCLD